MGFWGFGVLVGVVGGIISKTIGHYSASLIPGPSSVVLGRIYGLRFGSESLGDFTAYGTDELI